MNQHAAIAVNRFGLGARPGEMEAAASNPRRWLLEQLEGPYVEPKQFKGFATTAQHRENYSYRYNVLGRGLNEAQRKAKEAGDQAEVDRLGHSIARMLGGYVTWVAENFMLEYGARTNVAMTTDKPFHERLVRFWSNHLVVPAIKQPCGVVTGAYEREVIRPHVTGKFSDMLKASAQNPAMLVFLDNHLSIGPNSTYGRAKKVGLNENLAREILELHTMGVEGGYTQADVIQLAYAITGWSTYPAADHAAYQLDGRSGKSLGSFVFLPEWHEPGEFTVVGKTYKAGGVEQGQEVLYDLARRPETARYLASKLARHFVVDEPAPDLVERLANTYLENDTDLTEMTRALVDSEEPWNNAQSKLKLPEDYAISCYRSLGLTISDRPVPPQTMYNVETYVQKKHYWAWLANDTFGFLKTKDLDQFTEPDEKLGASIASFYSDVKSMGHSPWNAPGPQGWYDRWSDWSGADSMLKRVEWSLTVAAKNADRMSEPVQYLNQSLGDLASPELKTEVARAASAQQALGLALASPDFQRR